jgi:hypothetical protein
MLVDDRQLTVGLSRPTMSNVPSQHTLLVEYSGDKEMPMADTRIFLTT